MATVTPTYKNTSSFTQFGTVTGPAGASGNVVVTLPVAYTTATSYNIQASHNDTAAGARFSVSHTSAKSFTIYWISASAAAQVFDWFTIGS
jgi:hypothetical protein